MSLCKRIFRATPLALIALMLAGGTIFAAYTYYATVQVQETGGNSYSYLPIITDIDNDHLADNGYMSLTGLDTRVLAGSTELKHLVADDKVLFVVPSVGDNSTGNYKYTLGNTDDLDSFPIITGYNGHVTVSDNDTLEGTDNFKIELKGYVDTTQVGANLTIKDGAFRTYIPGAGDLRTILSLGLEHENYETGFDAQNYFWADTWRAQSFNATSGYWLTGVGVSANRVGDAGTCFIAIRATAPVGTPNNIVPTGANLTSVEFPATDLTLGGHEWYHATFDTPILLTDTIKYAIVFAAPSGDAANYLGWATDQTAPTYAEGWLCGSADSGVTWLNVTSVDTFFRTLSSPELTAAVASGEHEVETRLSGLEFSAANDYVDFGAPASLEDLYPTTIEAWIYPTGYGGGGFGRLIEKDNIWFCNINLGDKTFELIQHFSGQEGRWRTPLNSILLDRWYHVAIVYDSSHRFNNPVLYINGDSVVVTETQGPAGDPVTDAGKDLYIGNNVANTRNFDGIIDEVRIYNRLVGAPEVLEHFNGLYADNSDLVGLWHFDESTGVTTVDSSVLGNDGTLSGGIPAWSNGTLSMYVDGATANVTPATRMIDNSSDWTLAQDNAMPYLDYYKHTVDGTLIAWYQPISMIVGTNLDDREGTDIGETGTAEEDATIVWGANPADLSAIAGSLISSDQPSISPAEIEETPDIVPEGAMPAGGVVNTVELEDNPLYPIVQIINEHTDYTEEQIWFGGATLFILIGMGLAAVKVHNHMVLAGTVGLVLAGFFTAMGIYQWWMMLIFGFMFIMSILMERKPVF